MSEPAPPDIPYRFERTHEADAVVEGWSALAPGEESGVTVGVAGRIMLSRPQGKLSFAELRDNSGSVQLFALAAVPTRSTSPSVACQVGCESRWNQSSEYLQKRLVNFAKRQCGQRTWS